MNYLQVKSDGLVKIIKKKKIISSQALEKIVGGPIKFFPVENNKVAVFNKFGKKLGFHQNIAYSRFYGSIIIGRLDNNNNFIGLK